MKHSKSRCRSEHSDISELVESRSEDPDRSGDADESAPVRLETAPTRGVQVSLYFKISL